MEKSKLLFEDFAPKPEEHFRLCFFGSILCLIDRVAENVGSFEEAARRFPFLAGYNNELAAWLSGLSTEQAREFWCTSLKDWEEAAPVHLPLRALRQTLALSHAELIWLLLPGLVEEDSRFGAVFAALQDTPNQPWPTFGFLRRSLLPCSDEGRAIRLLHSLAEMGVLDLVNPEAPRQDRAFKFSSLVWDALRTNSLSSGSHGIRYRTASECLVMDELVLPAAQRLQVEMIPQLLASGTTRALIVRGPRHNGRHTVVGAVARSLGRGLLEVKQNNTPQNPSLRQAGALAILLNAMPVVEFTLGPGEVANLPEFCPSLPVGVVAGMEGSLTGDLAERSVLLQLELPRPEERRQLWQRSHLPVSKETQAIVANRYRLTAGNIMRAGTMAQAKAALAGRTSIEPADVLAATRTFDRRDLDSLARRVPCSGDLSRLHARDRTLEDLEHLARRCRQRESLAAALSQSPGGPLNCGVRALFSGPSGVGKTLAARLLAGTLQKDLYRLDLSAIANKFIGETEKSLNRVFDCAEELDVVLVLDEGDSLLTQRTDVRTSNDRYANLETNFLLQRIETFQGILIITTNARQRIDSAFERRMDTVVEFGLPSAEVRWHLWQSHLPANTSVDQQLLAQVAADCELTGGQIHNAVLHATLLALDNGGTVTSEYLAAAVRLEYRKRGGVCPLRG